MESPHDTNRLGYFTSDLIYMVNISFSSFVKMISDRENNFIQSKCNKWIKYIYVLPIHNNANIGSSAMVYLVYRHDRYANSKLIIDDIKRITRDYLQLRY